MSRQAGTAFGRFLGVLSGAAGVALLGVTLAALVSKSVARRIPVFPFNDRLARVDTLPAGAVLALAGVLLLVAGWGLLGRRRFVAWYYPVAGWLGFLGTLAAVWPRERLWRLAEFTLNGAKEGGRMPRSATVMDPVWVVVPTWVWPTLGAVLAAWLLLLITGTLHVRRRRSDIYVR